MKLQKVTDDELRAAVLEYQRAHYTEKLAHRLCDAGKLDFHVAFKYGKRRRQALQALKTIQL